MTARPSGRVAAVGLDQGSREHHRADVADAERSTMEAATAARVALALAEREAAAALVATRAAEQAARAATRAAATALRRAERAARTAVAPSSSAALAHRDAEQLAQGELGRLKNEFLGTVSHELRTPLQVVSGYAQLAQRWLQRPGADPDLAHLIERIVLSAGQLTRMVNQLLDLAALEQGALAVHVAEVDLTPVLRDVADGLRGAPGAERLVVVLPESLPARADRARAAQVAASLLANALAYAPEGPITLRARRLPSGAARVAVQDCGPGIPPPARRRVWERFSRSPDALLSAPRGLGIGLAMVKTLVEAQGGRVGLGSAPGGGSRFWFELPGVLPVGRAQ